MEIGDLVNTINSFLDKQSKIEIHNMEGIIAHMDEWRKRYDGKFRTSSVFREMFFKEMKSMVE